VGPVGRPQAERPCAQPPCAAIRSSPRTLPKPVAPRRASRPAGSPSLIRLVAGADSSCGRADREVSAAFVVFTWPDLRRVEEAWSRVPVPMPYVPGLLGFREGPGLLAAWRELAARPDLVFFDGHGIAHPRRLGIAAHLGLLLDVPSIGVAKSVLCGDHRPPGPRRGDREPLVHRGEEVGTVLRSKDGVAPLFVSPGHRVGPEEAVKLVLEAGRGYRLPEPVRAADELVGRVRREGRPPGHRTSLGD